MVKLTEEEEEIYIEGNLNRLEKAGRNLIKAMDECGIVKVYKSGISFGEKFEILRDPIMKGSIEQKNRLNKIIKDLGEKEKKFQWHCRCEKI